MRNLLLLRPATRGVTGGAYTRLALRLPPRSGPVVGVGGGGVRRGYAGQASEGGSSGKSHNDGTDPSSPPANAGGGGTGRLPIYIAGAVLLAMIPGRYILASDKPARSGQAERSEQLNTKDLSQHKHDPRDSGVKTVEQKKQKEQSS